MHHRMTWLLALGFTVGAPAALRAGSTQDLASAADAAFAKVTGVPSPGAAVVLLHHGKVVLSRTAGLADVEKGEAITTRTRFRLASISKSFTALLALRLVEEGRLGLDDPIAKHLAGVGGGDRILVRHLLSHTAGLPDFMSVEDALKLPAESAPGERLNYSNVGYALLARVIEKAGGRSYEAQLRAGILDPLGMKDTGVDYGEGAEKRWATGYVVAPEGGVRAVEGGPVSGESVAAGGLHSTAEDMTVWLQALLAGRIVKPATLAEAAAPVRLAGGRTGGYGFGFMTMPYRGLAEFGHGGDIDGFNSWFSVYPQEHLAVVVLSNVAMRPPGALPTAADIAHRLVDVAAADRLGPEWPPVIDLPLPVLQRYTGRYRLVAPPPVLEVMGATLDITLDAGRVVASSKMGQAEIHPESETRFFSRGPARITFDTTKDGPSQGGVLTLMGLREFRFEREP